MTIATPTILNTTTNSDNATTSTSGSVSPAANALLIVLSLRASADANDNTPIDLTDTFSPGLTWTKQATAQRLTASRGANAVVWTAQTGASPGSGTVTATANHNSNRRVLHVIQITSGFNTTTPVKQAKDAVDSSNEEPFVLTLDTTPDSDSMILAGFSGRNTTNLAKDSAYTELAHTSAGSNADSMTQYQNGGSPDTTVQVNNTSTDSTLGPDAAVAIEIDAAAAAGGDSLAPFGRLRMQRNPLARM